MIPSAAKPTRDAHAGCHPATTAAQSPMLPMPENRKYPPASNRLKVISSQKK